MTKSIWQKYYSIPLTILIMLIFSVSLHAEAARKNALKFSNTSEWSEYYLSFANGSTYYPEELFADISLPPPPANSSMQVMEEMRILKSYRNLRTPKLLDQFSREGKAETLEFGGYTLAEFRDAKLFPATAELLKDSFHDMEVIEMREKKVFDRVRPSALDPSFDTATPVHGHPAYPSYRSSEMHFLAHIFSVLAPERHDEFFERAYEIAFHCQIAGLQYPSDTEAGISLGKQTFDSMMKSSKFRNLLAAAREEWLAKGLAKSSN